MGKIVLIGKFCTRASDSEMLTYALVCSAFATSLRTKFPQSFTIFALVKNKKEGIYFLLSCYLLSPIS